MKPRQKARKMTYERTIPSKNKHKYFSEPIIENGLFQKKSKQGVEDMEFPGVSKK